MNDVIVDGAVVHLGSCLDILPTLADNSIDAVVTDPPYELGFMGKLWDSSGIAFNSDVWRECLRVLKPGGHLLAFGGSRTWHRIAVAIEDSGFQVRDSIAWLYGSGFPKSLDMSKAIDKANGFQGEVIGTETVDIGMQGGSMHAGREKKLAEREIHSLSDEAQKWSGWGTALKPAFEPIVVARKPLIGTVAANVLAWGTGALNIDGTRIGTEGGTKATGIDLTQRVGDPKTGFRKNNEITQLKAGRWPANVMLDEHTAQLLDEQADCSRFFYVAKASKRDRNEGLDELPIRRPDERTETGMGTFAEKGVQPAQNFHPTVKPTDLMRQLIRLVTPPGGTVLDPFTGSGSTGKAAILEGFNFIGCELTADYLPIIKGRLEHARKVKDSQVV